MKSKVTWAMCANFDKNPHFVNQKKYLVGYKKKFIAMEWQNVVTQIYIWSRIPLQRAILTKPNIMPRSTDDQSYRI